MTCLPFIYYERQSPFLELLVVDSSVSIHMMNIQSRLLKWLVLPETYQHLF